MATKWIQTALLAIALTLSGSVIGLAQSSQPKSDTYTWNGEFVSLDTTAKTMTSLGLCWTTPETHIG